MPRVNAAYQPQFPLDDKTNLPQIGGAMRLKQQILTVAAAFCQATGRSESRVSTRVFGGGHRIKGLRAGLRMNSDSLEDGLAWFSAHWPEGAEWPSSVPRPDPAPSATDAAPIGASA